MKKILMVVIGLIVLVLLGFGALIYVSPTEFKVEREVVINKPKDEVFSYLKLLKNQNDWGPWVKKDPKIKLEYRGTDGEVGFVSRWESESEELGVGEQEIKKIVDGERIDTELRFVKPWEATNSGYFVTEDAGENRTKVKWGFTGTMDRPMNLMLVFTDFEGIVSKDLGEGLDLLKSILEKQPSPEPKPDDETKPKPDKDSVS
jgi:uncharacterized membrane protein